MFPGLSTVSSLEADLENLISVLNDNRSDKKPGPETLEPAQTEQQYYDPELVAIKKFATEVMINPDKILGSGQFGTVYEVSLKHS